MIELVAVLVVIGVMSAIAVGFFSSMDYTTEETDAEQLRMDLRYAQQQAMGSLTNISVRMARFNNSYYFKDTTRVFANGARKNRMKSNLSGRPWMIVFKAQSGLPKKTIEHSYQVGESAMVTVDVATGLIQ